jgi:hypothetical protein
VAIRAKAKGVFRDIRCIVGTPKGLDVADLSGCNSYIVISGYGEKADGFRKTSLGGSFKVRRCAAAC